MSDEDKELNSIQKIVDDLSRIPKLALILKLSTDVTAVAWVIWCVIIWY